MEKFALLTRLEAKLTGQGAEALFPKASKLLAKPPLLEQPDNPDPKNRA